MKKKIFFGSLVSALCAFSLILGVVFGMGLNSRDNTPTVQDGSASEDFLLNIPDNGNGIKLISNVVETESLPAEMKSSFTYLAAYMLNATVIGTEDTSVTYSVAYEDGTPVESDIVFYFSVENSLHIGFFKIFNQTVVVTATSNANPNATASCNIDCHKEYDKVEGFTFTSNGVVKTIENGGTYIVDVSDQFSSDPLGYQALYHYNGTYGSNSAPGSEHWCFWLTSEAMSALDAAGIDYSYGTDCDTLYSLFSMIDGFEADSTSAVNALSGVSTIFQCDLTIEFWDENGEQLYESVEGTFYVGGFDFSSFVSNDAGSSEELVYLSESIVPGQYV